MISIKPRQTVTVINNPLVQKEEESKNIGEEISVDEEEEEIDRVEHAPVAQRVRASRPALKEQPHKQHLPFARANVERKKKQKRKKKKKKTCKK